MSTQENDEISTSIVKSLCNDIPSECYQMVCWKILKREYSYDDGDYKDDLLGMMSFHENNLGNDALKILKKWNYRSTRKGGD